ncbi:hypothetical protein BDQ17DRAFT_1544577 [Cyathus striatus]|nr:hypothetical protein BDQ17DRAFT_1544577 [Cyathus striatus]
MRAMRRTWGRCGWFVECNKHNFLRLFRFIFIFNTPYDVKSVMEDTAQVDSLVKKFSAHHTIRLMIVSVTNPYARMCTHIVLSKFSALFTTNAHQGRFTWTALIIGAILFTRHISLAYDGLNEAQFQDYRTRD